MVVVDADFSVVFMRQAPRGGGGVWSRGNFQATTPPRLAWIFLLRNMSSLSDFIVSFDRTAPPIRCHSLAEMDAALDRLHAEKRSSPGCPLAVAISISGFEVYIGLGFRDGFVMLGAEPYDDWYCALSDEKAEDPKKIFYGVCDDCYWGPRHLIPVGIAREAVRYFVEHHERHPNIQWEH